MSETVTVRHSTRELASFLARLRFDDIPDEAVERTKDLFLDWVGSALAGSNERPVRTLERFAREMGPAGGPSEDLTSRRRTSPLFAALVNGAASHVVEQDDLHNASVFHPATVVFPAALAAAQQTGASGREFLAASVAGYEAGVRVGRFLGRSHYRVFHTTGTAGTLAAAAAVSHLLGAGEETTLHALGSAGTQAAGLWEFLRDAADSKQLHTAKAASDGLLAAYLARDGFTGAGRILEGERGMAAGMSSDADPNKLVEGLGASWAVLETSFKYHASCRHTHPAADALLKGMREHRLAADDITRVRACVHQAAIDVLGPVTDPRTIHQSKFSMGFVLAVIARNGSAGINDFTEEALGDAALRRFSDKVEMVLDSEVDAAYPRRWIGLVEIETKGGGRFTSRVDVPKGDPGNTLGCEELEEKARNLAAYGGGASEGEMDRIVARIWGLEEETDVRDLLPEGSE
ncbi:MmgE/PrpD family protein [Rubrobacter tropicus]|uniref:MmgE/PrpD family protein n=1 Tax=Rubrobacter tropicus TaxID=2653851 RepID=A0A6G8Q608_9ACTN|nr:MmgE/PrpD family protein [Rubrobacter tropicus]QIN81890.1 MmgE/PrpD family protein [Rubrobacter tropicus]